MDTTNCGPGTVRVHLCFVTLLLFSTLLFRGYAWKLLYSLSRHGASLATLISKCHKEATTLLVVQVRVFSLLLLSLVLCFSWAGGRGRRVWGIPRDGCGAAPESDADGSRLYDPVCTTDCRILMGKCLEALYRLNGTIITLGTSVSRPVTLLGEHCGLPSLPVAF